ncbi:MAG: 3-phosphoshikimate 1-carboxyvinyltransferase [Dehalococcoidia bacterium]|nr:3-phosphoshikimate 1-carboxyvinyltransferase [Dehalococcoidia bacterium]
MSMLKQISLCPGLRGEITPPGDKSISHRAVMLNSIARGRARLSNFSPAADCGSTLTCLQALGVNIGRVSSVADAIDIHGLGKEGLREADDVLYAGNSATTMRLLSGLLAAQPFFSIITGDNSLRSRPMDRVISPLRLMGADIWGRGEGSLAPLAIKGGQLHGIEYVLPVPSAQIKSAILMAALLADGETIIHEPAKSRDHTERMLQAMGVSLRVDGCCISVTPPDVPPNSIDFHIPGDISCAAYWLIAGAIHPDARIRIKDTGMNPTRTGIVDVLLKMGATLRIENQRRTGGGEPLTDLLIESSELTGTEIGGDLIPRLIDEIPVIAVAACVAKGVTVIKDAAELRVKETDRIRDLVNELSKFGATLEEMPDGMTIYGGAKLRGARCSSHYDHRLAMALGIAGLVAEGETVIEDAEVVEVSYPTFWQDMRRITAN